MSSDAYIPDPSSDVEGDIYCWHCSTRLESIYIPTATLAEHRTCGRPTSSNPHPRGTIYLGIDIANLVENF